MRMNLKKIEKIGVRGKDCKFLELLIAINFSFIIRRLAFLLQGCHSHIHSLTHRQCKV